MRPLGRASSYYGKLMVLDQHPMVRKIWYTKDDELEFCEPFGLSRDYESHASADDERVELIRQALDDLHLTRQEHQVLHMRFYMDLTFKECGDRLLVSGERVRQHEMRLLRRLRRKFEKLQQKP